MPRMRAAGAHDPGRAPRKSPLAPFPSASSSHPPAPIHIRHPCRRSLACPLRMRSAKPAHPQPTPVWWTPRQRMRPRGDFFVTALLPAQSALATAPAGRPRLKSPEYAQGAGGRWRLPGQHHRMGASNPERARRRGRADRQGWTGRGRGLRALLPPAATRSCQWAVKVRGQSHGEGWVEMETTPAPARGRDPTRQKHHNSGLNTTRLSEAHGHTQVLDVKSRRQHRVNRAVNGRVVNGNGVY
ncbi:MAG: hypothetical protein J3K34DRAFT_523532 [Monoraphidium minutum]|nr:MAG: hypothetical protein J3K34DRAFT_523532 [Monoraphidium minutum]